jgi:hypothetical protein
MWFIPARLTDFVSSDSCNSARSRRSSTAPGDVLSAESRGSTPVSGRGDYTSHQGPACMTWRAIWIVWPMPLTRLRDSRHARRLIGGDDETTRQALVSRTRRSHSSARLRASPRLTVKPPLTQMAYAREPDGALLSVRCERKRAPLFRQSAIAPPSSPCHQRPAAPFSRPRKPRSGCARSSRGSFSGG